MNVIRSSTGVPEGIDAFVVPGKQFGIGSNFQDIQLSPDHLSVESRFSVTAAGMLWSPGRRILLSGNKRALFPQAAQLFLSTNFPEIPEDCYANPDDESPHTMASANNVPAILEAEGHTNAAVITVGFHAKRAIEALSKTSDLVKCVVASEDIVAERSPEDCDYVMAWRGLTRVRAEYIKEMTLRSVVRGSKIGQLAAELLRP